MITRQILVSLCTLASFAYSSVANVILEWNEIYLDSIRHVGGPPGPISREGAILFVSIYDAVNSIDRTHQPYVALHPVAVGASREAAVAAAAHRALTTLFDDYPELRADFDALYATQLAAISNGPAKMEGKMLGRRAADAVLALRANDRIESNQPYRLNSKPGNWQPTMPDFTFPPLTAHWLKMQPWTLTSGKQFRPEGPAGYHTLAELLRSSEYAAAFNEVKELGSLNSTTRTAEQTLIARFWANDRNGTYKPPGHLNSITQLIAVQQQLNLSETSRLFALVNLAMADAAIAAWDCKYGMKMNLWRPITAIREAHRDSNPATLRDPNWQPFSNDADVNGFSPAFPAYVSGHATFAAAWAAAIGGFFGSDQMTYTITSDDTPGIFRTFHSFTAAALENGESRIYLGVHYRFDAHDGFIVGTQVGAHVSQHYLRPLN